MGYIYICSWCSFYSTQKNNDPYITHPLEATKLLLKLKPDLVTVQSCILHDVIEDTDKNEADIEKFSGKKLRKYANDSLSFLI